jgi:hypothetical protein
MLYTLWLTGTQPMNECLTFQDTQTQIKNNCSFIDEHGQLFNQTYEESCLACTISDIHQVPKSNCQKSLTCIKLFFNHNMIFEEFFKKYHHIIEDLYINDMNHTRSSTLFIHIKHYNLTEINFAYLNSIFHINSQPYKILKIEFSQYAQELKPLMIIGDFSLMTISNVTITIPCNTSNQTINYRIQSGKITSTKSAECQVSQSTNLTMSMVKFSLTTMIVLHTSTNITTSSSSKPGSSLLYLFFAFFIITICVIITSFWSFFRQNSPNNHHDTDDERLSGMYKIMNTNKYDITDKDSKSAASWSHGSAIMLSPLVK